MKRYYLKNISNAKRNELLKRPAITSNKVKKSVQEIIDDIKRNGLESAIRYAKMFDNYSSENICTSDNEFKEAEELLPSKIKAAIRSAYKNIYAFHKKQYPKNYSLITIEGVKCERKFIPIENVGLYIPAGTAPLPSTMLMLGIPAQIAGCKRIVAASPAKDKIHQAILFAAKLCGITEFLKIGGVQGISLLAYGGNEFKKVDKIFGPGNQYVTAAKGLISLDPDGCSIDMIAGPSELLIIADEEANPEFVAADLLSQAEHGNDSVVVLVTTNDSFANKVNGNISEQIEKLPRKGFAKGAIKNSFCLIVNNLDEAFKFSNDFAPEHLIINLKNANKYLSKIVNAGSVFIGQYSPESAGDYASGTNHCLPTYGFARSTGGTNVEMFMKAVTFQSIMKTGLKNLSDTIITLAEAESLQAHAEAVKIRLR
jgi:histidinol dehydrogenase